MLYVLLNGGIKNKTIISTDCLMQRRLNSQFIFISKKEEVSQFMNKSENSLEEIREGGREIMESRRFQLHNYM